MNQPSDLKNIEIVLLSSLPTWVIIFIVIASMLIVGALVGIIIFSRQKIQSLRAKVAEVISNSFKNIQPTQLNLGETCKECRSSGKVTIALLPHREE